MAGTWENMQNLRNVLFGSLVYNSLIMRIPWMPSASSGKHTRALVGCDIYQTFVILWAYHFCDTVPFDGVSLRPVLKIRACHCETICIVNISRCSVLVCPYVAHVELVVR